MISTYIIIFMICFSPIANILLIGAERKPITRRVAATSVIWSIVVLYLFLNHI